MDDENRAIAPENDPYFRQKGIAFTVFWTLLTMLAAYMQYR